MEVVERCFGTGIRQSSGQVLGVVQRFLDATWGTSQQKTGPDGTRFLDLFRRRRREDLRTALLGDALLHAGVEGLAGRALALGEGGCSGKCSGGGNGERKNGVFHRFPRFGVVLGRL